MFIRENVMSTVKPDAVNVLGNKVLVAENITEEMKTDEIGGNETLIYHYDEKVYSKDEYIKLISEENTELDGVVDDLTQLLIDKGLIW